MAPAGLRKSFVTRLSVFCTLLVLLVGAAILRSAQATHLDSFTFDEAYHIAAGVSYVRHADFRINPEHPPLVKLWVGSFIAATGFHLDDLRPFADKVDERDFAEQDVYLHNDFNSVQRRARIAMWALNGLLLVLLGFALRRAFGPGVALGTLLFLAIDPTVAAHLPVVMTDLPVSLLAAAAVVFSIRAFGDWSWPDLAACSGALGLALATKHSAPVFLIFIVLTGALLALFQPASSERAGAPEMSRLARLARLLAVVAGSLFLLWGAYFLHFAESHTGREVFNRPLADKIADVHSPVSHAILNAMTFLHLTPRAYIWGLADTIRAGVEGRYIPILAFGRSYLITGPKYFFPAMIALKLPIGLSVLVLIGLVLVARRCLASDRNPAYLRGLMIVLAAAGLFLLVLASGSTYGGIRHALPVVVLLSIVAGVALQSAFSGKSRPLQVVVAVALVAAALAALPVVRPWEYFNQIIGGAGNGYKYFSDEGLDLSQRSRELAAYYHQVLEPAGEIPLIGYPVLEPERKARGLDWLGRDPERDGARLSSPELNGTVFYSARRLGKRPFWDPAGLRNRVPTARFGDLLVFRGRCDCGPILAPGLYFHALSKIYAEKPDLAAGEQFLRQALSFDASAFFVNIELGNLELKRGSREQALEAYSGALQSAPSNDPEMRGLIEEQIQRVSSQPLNKIPDLRNPLLE